MPSVNVTNSDLCTGVFPVVISREFALALTIYTVATQLLLYYVRKLR